MTVRNMIQQLINFPMDTQVVDTYGSPIMYMLYHNRDKNSPVRLESKSQMDVDSWLDDFFETKTNENDSDIDVFNELIEQGFTANDLYLYNSSTYEWAKNLAKEYEIDF